MSSKVKKYIDESRETKNPELELVDKGIVNLPDVPGLLDLTHLTRLTLAHNKINGVPPNITQLANLEHLNLFNNHIKELPSTINSLMKLKYLNLGMNKLTSLPRGFGAFPVLEVLDLTYNNLSENSLPGNFFCLDTLRALYLGDNDFERIPVEIMAFKNLQISSIKDFKQNYMSHTKANGPLWSVQLVLRDNDLVAIPKEVGELPRLRELHIQGNRLTVLPPEIGNLDLVGSKQAFRGENNPWVTPIADQYQVGVSHVFDYIRSDTYRFLYGRHIAADAPPPPKANDKSKKISRMG